MHPFLYYKEKKKKNGKCRPVRYALPDNGIHKNSEKTTYSDSHGNQSEYGNSSDSDGEDYL